ncbi:MBL fold metallo-hydrolase [Alkalibaculum sp. M08DMB]|uniref:MBL fold metallo-hydrolase n=1 Tax=Alkalibaculum sporogenes TaxID=2655001 RepID=A0A6A7K6G3_9FIRM|nr:MBL fold metallo-hydrolase [Alkalibaculum sporogenes]MPW24964.1 MBL fold metallo-hydrolase [Alkalibaculum sporogenes]
MIIQHLSHSGFLVEDKSTLLIFDAISDLPTDKEYKNIYCFASHSHKDHFNPQVIKHFYGNENAKFIFSKDISSNLPDNNKILFLDNYEKSILDDVKINAYGSTDLGNSYLVSLNGKSYFHSGDLNWWHWQDKMNNDKLKIEESSFKKEVELLKDESIDFAFIPVDPRLKEHAYLAINYFITVVKPKYVIPMHSFGDYNFYKGLEYNISLIDSALILVDKENKIIFNDSV